MDRQVKVLYYTSVKGENPVSDFLDSLSSSQQTKILRVIKNLREYGISSILPHTKKLFGTPLWEIRILGKDNIRVLYVIQTENSVLILHGFIKKRQKTPPREISIAITRLADWKFRKSN